jgi:hypothetical protein
MERSGIIIDSETSTSKGTIIIEGMSKSKGTIVEERKEEIFFCRNCEISIPVSAILFFSEDNPEIRKWDVKVPLNEFVEKIEKYLKDKSASNLQNIFKCFVGCDTLLLEYIFKEKVLPSHNKVLVENLSEESKWYFIYVDSVSLESESVELPEKIKISTNSPQLLFKIKIIV